MHSPQDPTPEQLAAASPERSIDRHSFLATGALLDQQAGRSERVPRWTVVVPSPGEAAPGETPSDTATRPAFRLLRIIGRGGMGEVWEAEQCSLDRIVAVKRVRDGGDGSVEPAELASFHHEALVSARLEHPNIVPVHDLGTGDKGEPLLAMKCVNGQPWNQVLREDFRSLSPGSFLARHIPILIDVANAVGYAHSQGFVHRDLKPSQVMVGSFGEVLLMDWGLAVFAGRDAGEARQPDLPPIPGIATLETASSPAGTPVLMAPEQTQETAAGVGPWTDVFLLGGTLYYLLTGTFPFQAESSFHSMLRARRCDFEPPSERSPGREIPADLEALCLECMREEPQERLGSATEFVARLQDFMSGVSRQNESLALAESMRARMAGGEPDYRAWGEIIAGLTQARTLWRENREAAEQLEHAIAGFARLALRQGDLALARAQAERLAPGAPREDLVSRITAEEKAVAARARQRVLAIRGVALAVAAIVIGGAAFTMALKRERNAAIRQKDLAQDARAKSQALVDFMVKDLRKEVALVDPSFKSLDTLVKKAAPFYADQPVELLSPRQRLDTYRGLRETAALLRVQGKPTEALPIARSALEKYRRDAAARPPGDDGLVEESEFLRELAEITAGASSRKDAIPLWQEGIRIVRPVLAHQPLKQRAADTYFGQLYHLMAEMQEQGRFDDIRPAIDEFTAAMRRQLEATPGDVDLRAAMAEDLVMIASMEGKERRHKEALDLMASAGAMLDAIPAERSTAPDLLLIWSRYWTWLSTIRFEKGDFPDAAAAADKAVGILRQLVALSPGDLSRRHELFDILVHGAAAHQSMGHLSLALAAQQDAQKEGLFLVQRDPNVTTNIQNYLVNRMAQFGIFLQLFRWEELQAGIDEVLPMIPPFDKGDRNATESLILWSSFLSLRATALAALGHPDEALKTYDVVLAGFEENRAKNGGLTPIIQNLQAVNLGQKYEALNSTLQFTLPADALAGAREFLGQAMAVSPMFARDLGRLRAARADQALYQGELAVADTETSTALADLAAARIKIPSYPDLAILQARVRQVRAELQRQRGDLAGATTLLREALETYAVVRTSAPERLDVLPGMASLHAMLADLQLRSGHADAAAKSLESARELLALLGERIAYVRVQLPNARILLAEGRLERFLGHDAGAAAKLHECMAVCRDWRARGYSVFALPELAAAREVKDPARVEELRRFLESRGVASAAVP